MQRDIDIGRIGVETLAEHQAGLAMRFRPTADKSDIRRERNVPRSLFPGKMKRILRRPHIFTAAGDGIRAGAGVYRGLPLVLHLADIAMAFEQAERARIAAPAPGPGWRHSPRPRWLN